MKDYIIRQLRVFPSRCSTIMLRVFLPVFILSAISCSHSELWNELPSGASSFINHYYPMSELNSVTHSGETYHVRIDNGPGLTFDESGSWISVDGYGMPLPEVMLFDQLPPRMY